MILLITLQAILRPSIDDPILIRSYNVLEVCFVVDALRLFPRARLSQPRWRVWEAFHYQAEHCHPIEHETISHLTQMLQALTQASCREDVFGNTKSGACCLGVGMTRSTAKLCEQAE
jgi:hypothetical protein